MEKYIVTPEEKKGYLKEFPVLECSESFAVDYGEYFSVKCKKIMGTCTYRGSQKDEYKNCRLLNK